MSHPLPDADARRDCADLSQHVLATAPAGSGKTGLLVLRLLRALAVVDEPEQVIAITFTNKAAAEIRRRVSEALHQAQHGYADKQDFARELLEAARAVLARSAQQDWRLTEHPARIRALTIDALNSQLAAQSPLSSGLGGPTRVAEDDRALYQQAVLHLFALLDETRLEPDLAEALHTLLRGAHNRLDRLMEPLCNLLSRREQWLPPLLAARTDGWREQQDELLRGLIERRIAALDAALDADAKAEFVALLGAGSAQHDLLGWAADLRWPAARAEHAAIFRQIAGTVVTDKGKLRSPRGISVKQGFVARQAYTQAMKDWLAAQAGNVSLEGACAGLLEVPDAGWPAVLVAPRDALITLLPLLAAELRTVFGEHGATDFGEIAQAAQAALRPSGRNGEYGEALLRADRRIRHLLVDEMQDTSESQLRLLEQLTIGWEAGDGRSLFLVGDPQQSIYGFRKAEVQLFLKLQQERKLGQLRLHCVALSCNFRSAPVVVDWFNHAFAQIFPTRPDADAREVPFTPSVALREADPQAQVEWCMVEEYADEGEAAAERIAALLTTLREGGRVGVLGRTRKHLAPALAALRRRNIHYSCQDVDPLAELSAVRDVIALARALWHPYDHLSWAVALRAPFIGLAWADLAVLSRGRQDEPWEARLRAGREHGELSTEGHARVARLLSVLDTIAGQAELRAYLAERVEAAWHALGGPACISDTGRVDVATAFRLLRTHSAAGELAALPAFERALSTLYGAPAGGKVEAMTVHKAKGLEFDHVLLVGCSQGTRREDKPPLHLLELAGEPLLVPAPPEQVADDDPAHRLYNCVHQLHAAQRKSETLRLLYVAVTRARRSLHLFLRAEYDDQGSLKAPANSFAGLLKPVIPVRPASPAPRQAEIVEIAASVPRAPRLPLNYRPSAAAANFRPRERRSLKPSEAMLEGERSDLPELQESRYTQLVGTLYHQALQKIGSEGLAAWTDAGGSRRTSLAAGFRRLGLPEPQVETAVARVLALLQLTLAGPSGRWLLAEKSWARSEYQLGGYLDGRWVSASIDRCFEEADGTLWVVDYKTAGRTLEGTALEAYLQSATERYREQVALYARLLQEQRPEKTVRAALYFADADRLAELPVS